MLLALLLLQQRIRFVLLALAVLAVALVVTQANAALVLAGVAAHLAHRFAGVLAVTVAQHLQVDDQLVLQADRSNADGLVPFGWILRTLQQFDLYVEVHQCADAQSRTTVHLERLVRQTLRVELDLHIFGQRLLHVVLQFNRRCNLSVLGLHQLHDVRRVVFQDSSGAALD